MSELQQKRPIAASAEMSSRPTEQKLITEVHISMLHWCHFYDFMIRRACIFWTIFALYFKCFAHLFVIMVSEASEVAGGSSGVKRACNSGID
jgi:hypothetical protein